MPRSFGVDNLAEVQETINAYGYFISIFKYHIYFNFLRLIIEFFSQVLYMYMEYDGAYEYDYSESMTPRGQKESTISLINGR